MFPGPQEFTGAGTIRAPVDVIRACKHPYGLGIPVRSVMWSCTGPSEDRVHILVICTGQTRPKYVPFDLYGSWTGPSRLRRGLLRALNRRKPIGIPCLNVLLSHPSATAILYFY